MHGSAACSPAIAVLLWQGRIARFKGPLQGTLGERVGSLRMLDLAAPAAALGYGVGRIGCLLSGDGDYGINTTLPWGVHMAKDALVPPNPPNALRAADTDLRAAVFAAALLDSLEAGRTAQADRLADRACISLLSGIGRFLVEFVRINPKLYFGHTMSNAQVAALGSVVAGIVRDGVGGEGAMAVGSGARRRPSQPENHSRLR